MRAPGAREAKRRDAAIQPTHHPSGFDFFFPAAMRTSALDIMF
jgi:hypothetical protein